MLSIHEARQLVPGQSATTLQVAAAVYAATAWMIKNPEAGLLVPDDLPWREIYDVAEKYLGPIWSAAADWDPIQTRNDLFVPWSGREYDTEDVCTRARTVSLKLRVNAIDFILSVHLLFCRLSFSTPMLFSGLVFRQQHLGPVDVALLAALGATAK